MSDHIYSLVSIRLATMIEGEEPYGLIDDAAIVIEGEKIVWSGLRAALPARFDTITQHDMGGRLVTPALIDCHTHLIHGGDRATEFEMRLEGASYAAIARAGGGIISTVKATRDATVDALIQQAIPRLDALLAEGVSTVEIKSGYGLNLETELNMLRAARALVGLRPVQIKTSFLGAHATPPEYEGRDDTYLEEVCIPTLRAAHEEGLVDAVDGFCEGIAFTAEQIERVFMVARELGLPIKLHADQLSHLGGTQLAAQYGALSVDHVEYASEDDAKAMAKSGSVAVILPGAFYTLNETQAPPITEFRRHGVPMAIATDYNPGSSPLTSLLLAINMACTLFRLTPAEALAGATINAAKALGLADCGQIRPGFQANLALWDIAQPAELSYRIGFNPLYTSIFRGTL